MTQKKRIAELEGMYSVAYRKRIAELEADRDRLREALEMFCGNIGTQEASSFNKTRFPATWQEGNAALSATGERERPDTVLLDRLERHRPMISQIQGPESFSDHRWRIFDSEDVIAIGASFRACITALPEEAKRG